MLFPLNSTFNCRSATHTCPIHTCVTIIHDETLQTDFSNIEYCVRYTYLYNNRAEYRVFYVHIWFERGSPQYRRFAIMEGERCTLAQ